MEWHTSRFLQACIIQYFWKVMATLWFADWLLFINATFHRYLTEWRTPRFLPPTITQYFSEVMALLWLADWMILDNATFRGYLMEWHTPRFLQVGITQYFSEVMALLLLVDGMMRENAPFHHWMTEFHTPRFLPATTTQYFSEVMALLCLADWTLMDNAGFRLLIQGLGTLQMCQFATRLFLPSWCYAADFLWFDWERSDALECKSIWSCLEHSQAHCPWIEGSTPKSSSGFAWWTVVGGSLPCKPRSQPCRCHWNSQASASHLGLEQTELDLKSWGPRGRTPSRKAGVVFTYGTEVYPRNNFQII